MRTILCIALCLAAVFAQASPARAETGFLALLYTVKSEQPTFKLTPTYKITLEAFDKTRQRKLYAKTKSARTNIAFATDPVTIGHGGWIVFEDVPLNTKGHPVAYTVTLTYASRAKAWHYPRVDFDAFADKPGLAFFPLYVDLTVRPDGRLSTRYFSAPADVFSRTHCVSERLKTYSSDPAYARALGLFCR